MNESNLAFIKKMFYNLKSSINIQNKGANSNVRNCINIKLGTNEILIRISDKAEQKEIIECLENKMEELKKLYKEEKTPILVTGKILTNDQMKEVEKVISNKIKVRIEFDSPKVLGLHGIKKAFNKEIESSETKFHRGSLRSGQRVEYDGSIVVLGDVNGGAEVIARDHIVVLGILRGLAHAGAKGNKKAIVAASSIEAPQIRISNIVKEIEKEENSRKNYAYVEKNDIILE